MLLPLTPAASESPVEINPAIPELTRNKQTDKIVQSPKIVSIVYTQVNLQARLSLIINCLSYGSGFTTYIISAKGWLQAGGMVHHEDYKWSRTMTTPLSGQVIIITHSSMTLFSWNTNIFVCYKIIYIMGASFLKLYNLS